MPPTRGRRWRRAVLVLALVLVLPQLVFSSVVILNSVGNATGAVWLPSFPAAYYALKSALELPLQPYLALFDGLRQNPAIGYAQYAALSRGPIVVASLAILLPAATRLLRSG
ncbi:MAG TPA: hypothetical protein VFX49_11120 [Chloroflexota bacterium]|nr:hypothetical protein [Chloroflexota bacterium]